MNSSLAMQPERPAGHTSTSTSARVAHAPLEGCWVWFFEHRRDVAEVLQLAAAPGGPSSQPTVQESCLSWSNPSWKCSPPTPSRVRSRQLQKHHPGPLWAATGPNVTGKLKKQRIPPAASCQQHQQLKRGEPTPWG